jgi:hypothetical protein
LFVCLLFGSVQCDYNGLNVTDYGDAGWCFGGVDEYVGKYYSAEACWNKCYSEYGNDLVAVDWWPNGYSGGQKNLCYCQDSCACRADSGSGGVLLMSSSEVYPAECENDPVVIPEDVGWCYGGVDHFYGYTSSANSCWSHCYGVLGDSLYAIDYWDSVRA